MTDPVSNRISQQNGYECVTIKDHSDPHAIAKTIRPAIEAIFPAGVNPEFTERAAYALSMHVQKENITRLGIKMVGTKVELCKPEEEDSQSITFEQGASKESIAATIRTTLDSLLPSSQEKPTAPKKPTEQESRKFSQETSYAERAQELHKEKQELYKQGMTNKLAQKVIKEQLPSITLKALIDPTELTFTWKNLDQSD